jgi:ribosome-binding factor A
MAGYRKERIEKQIRMIIAESLIKEIKDPRIGFVTITDVELNKDKSHAVVSVSVLGDDKVKKKSMTGLNSAKGFFQHRIGKMIKIRNTPKIIFRLDPSIEGASEMINTLNRIEEERTSHELQIHSFEGEPEE